MAELAGLPQPQTPGCCPRILTTPRYSAYLRIADGCDNRCAYCAIPLIRGPRKSVPMEDALAEAKRLAEGGVVELTVIAQDTSAYGSDLYGKPMLRELLLELCKIPGLHWIRVLYTYPNTVDTDLIDAMVREPKLVPYLDMPIQHIAPDILRRMNRHGTAEHIRKIAAYAREASPDFILRTTVIAGFPGETEEEFDQLTEFLQSHPFDRLGAFAYSQEENTPAAQMPDQVPDEVKAKRLDRIMTAQQAVSWFATRSVSAGRTRFWWTGSRATCALAAPMGRPRRWTAASASTTRGRPRSPAPSYRSASTRPGPMTFGAKWWFRNHNRYIEF